MTRVFDCMIILPVKKTGRNLRELRIKIVRMMRRYDAHWSSLRPYPVECFCVKHPPPGGSCKLCKGSQRVMSRANPEARFQHYTRAEDLANHISGIYQTQTIMGMSDIFRCADIYTFEAQTIAGMPDFTKPDAIVTPDGLWHDDVPAIIADWPRFKDNHCVVVRCTA